MIRAAFLAALVLASGAFAQEAKRFGVPGHGNLVLNVPAGWRVQEKSLPEPPSAYLLLQPASGDAFRLQLTVVRLDPAKAAAVTPAEMKQRMQTSARGMLSQAVETEVEVLELRGAQSAGAYFALTDRNSRNGPGDYPHVTQGMVVSGELVTVFTLLLREPAAPAKEQTLRMLADAVHAKDEPSATSAPRPDRLQVAEAGGSYVLSVPVSRLVMTIPKGSLVPTPLGGASSHPRYFYFSAGMLNLSGWFEPAQGYKGVQDFWSRELAGWKRQGLPEPREPEFSRLGDWDVVLYEMAAPAGVALPPGATNSHLRAHLVRAGTWIDLHISVIGKASGAENRAVLRDFLQTISVKEKDK